MEKWLPIPGHPGYEASNMGNIRGTDRVIPSNRWGHQFRKGQILKHINYVGRPAVTVGQPRRRAFVAVLVLETFGGPRPKDHDCCHSDGNKWNSKLSNLRWDTRAGNMQDAVRHGTTKWKRPTGENAYSAKLSSLDIEKIKKLRNKGIPQSTVARFFNVSPTHIYNITTGRQRATG